MSRFTGMELTEHPRVIALVMCDRIIVLRDGRTVGELKRTEFDEERIMALASGVEREAA